jgi:hypothetical protein
MLPWHDARASRASSIDDQHSDFDTTIATHSEAPTAIGTSRTGDFVCQRRWRPHEKKFVVDVRCANPGLAIDRPTTVTRLTSPRPSASTLYCGTRDRARRLNHAGDPHS